MAGISFNLQRFLYWSSSVVFSRLGSKKGRERRERGKGEKELEVFFRKGNMND
jgi:hypothetical protein